MSEDVAIDSQATVTVERDGRTLSGVGVSESSLSEAMEPRESLEPSQPVSGTEPAQSPPPADSQPKPTRGQARFAELTEQRRAAEAKAEQIQREFDAYKAQLAQTPPAVAPRPLETAVPAPPAEGGSPRQAGTATRDEPSEDEVGTKYQSYGEFVKDHQAWAWEQQQPSIAALVSQQLQAERTVQRRQALAESTWAKGRTVYSDFDAVLANGPGKAAQLPWAAIDAIYQHPQSEHLQYAILKDAAVAQRLSWIATNQPFAFGLELTKIAPAAPAVQSASTGTPGSATPPPPMKPVGSGSTTTSPTSADHAESGNYAAYKAARAAERGGLRRMK